MEERFALVAPPVGLRPPYAATSAKGAPSIDLPLLDKGIPFTRQSGVPVGRLFTERGLTDPHLGSAIGPSDPGNGGHDINNWSQLGQQSYLVPAKAVSAALIFGAYDVTQDGNAWLTRPFVAEVQPDCSTWLEAQPKDAETGPAGQFLGRVASATMGVFEYDLTNMRATYGLVDETPVPPASSDPAPAA